MANSLWHTVSYLRNVARVVTQADMPPDVIFFVTSRCNARCDYCHFLEQINDQGRKENELTVDEIRKIAIKYGSNISKLSLSGGEPFLRNDIAEIVKAFVEHCDVRIVDIPTNGSLTQSIVEQVQKILENHPFLVLEIQLSIDGTEEVHDSLRKVKGLYRKIIHTYEQLSPLREKYDNLRIKLNMTYQQGNEDSIIDMVRDFDEKYVFDRFQITFPHGLKTLAEHISELSYDKFYRLSREIQLHMRIRRRNDLHSLLFRAIKILRDEVLCEIIAKGDTGHICKAGKRIVVLDDIGNVFPCEPLWHCVGNVRNNDYSIRKVLSSQQTKQFSEMYLGYNKCYCTWGCVVLDSIIFNPKYYPRILYYLMYLLLRGGHGLKRSEILKG